MRADGRNDPHHGFGKGIEMLLLGVDKYGSLNRAAKEMGIQLGAIIKSPMEGLIKYHN